jgi:predicted DNA-binding protein YlxM (UPF0122 family)
MYSSLLTEKQRVACEMLLRGDLSVAELGEEMGTTRQGAHDLIRRSREFLDDIERELGLLRLTGLCSELESLIAENRHNLPAGFVQKAEKILSRATAKGNAE